jgi:uncharacterized protein (DUF1697 family)
LRGERVVVNARFAALIRGINVGRAKRVAMSDLRALAEDLGCSDVRTLLNSGNLVFTAPVEERPVATGTLDTSTAAVLDTSVAGARDMAAAVAIDMAAAFEDGLAGRLGVPARVLVHPAPVIDDVVAGNTLLDVADNPSRTFVAFYMDDDGRDRIAPLNTRDWDSELLGVGSHAAYLWCPAGLTDSALAEEVDRALGKSVTIRNWTTVLKLHALLGGQG